MAPPVPDGSRLRASCEQRVDLLDLPPRFGTRELREAITALRGKPVLLNPLSTLGAVDAPCGIRIETEQADLVFYEESTSPHHQRHIVTHELCHVYCDHPGSLEIDAATAHALGVSPTLAKRMWTRAGYSTADEREAETMASVIRQRIYRGREAPPLRPGEGTFGWDILFAQPVRTSRSRRR